METEENEPSRIWAKEISYLMSPHDTTHISDRTIEGIDITNNTINSTHIINISASQVNPGSFASGNYTFSNNITVDGNTLHVDSENSRVGIGTLNPVQKLEVSGNANITGTLYAETFNPINVKVSGTLNSTGKTFLSTSSGLVGIGDVDPIKNLHIKGSTDVTARLDRASTSNDAYIEFSTAESRDWAIRNVQTLDRLDISEDIASTLFPRLILEAGGNIGIGLVDPNSTLEVLGNFTVDKGVLKVDDTNNRVGINTETPTHSLNVIGNVNITNNITAGNLTVENYALFKNNITLGNVTPSANNTASLGSNQSFFKEIYVNLIHVINQITGSQIASETITSTNIRDEAVGSAEIQNLSIQSIDIGTYQINNTHIVLSSVNGSQIAIYSLNNTHISLNSINGSQIIQLSINNSHIASFAINNTQLGLDSINSSQIVDGAILGSDINTNANLTLLNLITNGQANLANLTITNNLTIGSQTLVAITNGTTNKVGINNTSPTTALDINGKLNLSQLSSSNNLIQIGSGIHNNLTIFSPNSSRFTCGVTNLGEFNCSSY